jgi:transposase-like protein
MSTGKPRDCKKEGFWRRMLQRWRQSGLSVRDFCARHGLSQPSFYAWRRTLVQRDAEVQFVPVRLTPEPTNSATATTSALELVLGDHRRLRIAPGFDGPTLTRLLALLEEGRPCS